MSHPKVPALFVTAGKDGRYMKVASCPFCGREHLHPASAPTYGVKRSLCRAPHQPAEYELVPDKGGLYGWGR